MGCDWDRCFYLGYCELNLNGRAEDCGAVDIMKVKKSRGKRMRQWESRRGLHKTERRGNRIIMCGRRVV